MEKEFIPIGGYVPLGGIRAYCVDISDVRIDPFKVDICSLCSLQHTQRCISLVCDSTERVDGKNAIFVVKLNPK